MLKSLENMTYKEEIIVLKEGNPIKILKYSYCKKRMPAVLSMPVQIRKEKLKQQKENHKTKQQQNLLKKIFNATETEFLKWTC